MRRVCDIVVLAALAFPAFALPQGAASSLLTKGQAALAAGKAAEAMRLGDAFVLKEPKRYEGHRLVARAALLLDRPDRAERAFREALRLAPPAVRPALQNDLRETSSLRQALQSTARARALKASGDLLAAARAQESAYRALPARYALGIAAAELFESAGRLTDARRVLEDVRSRHPKANAATHITQRLASLQVEIDAARRREAAESNRRQADEDQAAEARRIEARRAEEERQNREEARQAKTKEAERRAEEERQRAEKARLDQEEIARLTTILDGHRREASEAESAITEANGRVDDFERSARRFDNEADSARDRRDAAKRERDDLQSKLDDAKGDLSKQLLREQLRTAESKYDDAKGDYNRARDRYNDAKSSLEQWRSALNQARQRLEQARQDVRDTEAAIARVG